MPRESLQSITAVPQSQYRPQAPELTQVLARPVDTTTAVQQTTDLDGLVAGLSSLNPHLQRYLEVKDQKDAQQAEVTGEQQARAATIDPADVNKLPESMPEVVNPAFRPNFDKAYKQVLGQRLGIQASSTIQADFDKQKVNPDFDVERFLDKSLKDATSGITDPVVANEVAKHNIELSRSIRAEDNKVKLNALKDATISNFSLLLDNTVASSGNDPEALSKNFNALLSDGKAAWNNYFTRPEMSDKLVSAVTAHSVSDKGNPAVFDALDKIKDSTTGKTIAETSPELALKIAEGRKAAQKAQDQRIEKDSQVVNFQTMAQVEDGLKAGSKAYTDDWIAQNTGGPGKLFVTTEAALTFRKKRDAALNANDDLATTLSWMRDGKGYLADPKSQKAAADYATTPLVNQLMQLVDDPAKQPLLNTTIAQFAQKHVDWNLTIGNEVFSRFVEGLAKIPADSSGKPTPRFTAAASMYRALATAPTVRDMYFKDDSKALFDNYTKEVDAGVAPETAYKQSYQGISAESKEREKEITKTPDWQAKMLKMTTSAVDGLQYQWSKDYIPGRENLPSNLSSVTQGGGPLEAKRFMVTHPNASDDDLKGHMQKWVSDNYVHDTKSNMLVGVPPGVGQSAQKPIEWFQENLLKQYGEDSRPSLIYMGNGNYQVQTQNPIAIKASLTWDQLRKQHVEATAMSPEELAQVAALNTKASNGTLSPADIQASAPVLSKVRALGLQDKLPLKGINDAMDKSVNSALANIPKLALGGASNVLGPTPNSANDAASQQSIVNAFLNSAQQAAYIKGGSTQALAGALTTKGEGVVLKATPDPAGGAGNNIGIGYNLKANAATMAEDFRKAGIPVEAIEDIKAGRKSITEDQAQRLLQVSLPRYMDKAKGVIESKYPGMWDRMTPHQQAVVTDVAYQVKDFSKFSPSIDALFSGDQAKIDQAFQVKYTDHKGVTKVDTRRNNLRANMLKGTSNFMAVALNN